MERKKDPRNHHQAFEKGMDFLLYFSGRKFTIADIQERYCCTYRQAQRIKEKASSMVRIAPAGFALPEHERGEGKWLWEIAAR